MIARHTTQWMEEDSIHESLIGSIPFELAEDEIDGSAASTDNLKKEEWVRRR